MQEQRIKKKTTPTEKTATPGIYRRGGSYVAKWHEEKKVRWRTFSTYESACAFRRDYILPYRARKALPPTTAAPSKNDHYGWVYFFQSLGPGSEVKIGWSKDPRARLSNLSTAHPHGLALIALLPGDPTLERRMHEAFGEWRLSNGEWFAQEVVAELSARLAGP